MRQGVYKSLTRSAKVVVQASDAGVSVGRLVDWKFRQFRVSLHQHSLLVLTVPVISVTLEAGSRLVEVQSEHAVVHLPLLELIQPRSDGRFGCVPDDIGDLVNRPRVHLSIKRKHPHVRPLYELFLRRGFQDAEAESDPGGPGKRTGVEGGALGQVFACLRRCHAGAQLRQEVFELSVGVRVNCHGRGHTMTAGVIFVGRGRNLRITAVDCISVYHLDGHV